MQLTPLEQPCLVRSQLSRATEAGRPATVFSITDWRKTFLKEKKNGQIFARFKKRTFPANVRRKQRLTQEFSHHSLTQEFSRHSQGLSLERSAEQEAFSSAAAELHFPVQGEKGIATFPPRPRSSQLVALLVPLH